ncbi:MAG TPA: TetR family transcriptional regulator [Chloroflexota bacterium]
MSARVSQGKRADAVANHARILDAAGLVLAERGLDMEMDEVAERAGVGVGTLYRHFANRDALVRAIITQSFEDLLTRLRGAAHLEDPAMALREISFAIPMVQPLFQVFRDPRCVKLMQDVKHDLHQPVSAEIIDLISGIVERGMRSGAFRPDLDPAATANAILGSIGAVCENLGATRPLAELAAMLADLHHGMVAAR